MSDHQSRTTSPRTTLKPTGADKLRRIDLLSVLPEEDLDVLVRRCQWRRFQRNQLLLAHKDDSTDIFFVTEGRVRATIFSFAGKEVAFRDIEAGEIFGELSAIDAQPRSASVVAQSAGQMAVLPSSVFWEILSERPAVAAAMLRQLTSQVRNLSERVLEFSTLAVKDRIHAELLRLADGHTGPNNCAVISPAPTHVELASRLSTHREAVTRELSDLSHRGLVRRQKRQLILTDVRALSRMVETVAGH